MAIKPVLIYRNSDSTADLNSRFARIVDRGIFDGGHLSPSSTSLTMGIAPFVAAGYDGIVAMVRLPTAFLAFLNVRTSIFRGFLDN